MPGHIIVHIKNGTLEICWYMITVKCAVKHIGVCAVK